MTSQILTQEYLKEIFDYKDGILYHKRNFKRDMMNTKGINMIFDSSGNIDFSIIYNPDKIRTKYENFEVLNTDVCRLESIKGVVNSVKLDNSSFKDLEFVVNKNWFNYNLKYNLFYLILNVFIR